MINLGPVIDREPWPTMTPFTPRNPDFRDFVRAYVAAQRYLTWLGVELAQVEPGQATYRVVFRPELGQQSGFFHGGVIGGLAEAVMGAAAATLAPVGHDVVGASYTLNLMAPAVGAVLVASAQVIKPGRRLIVCRADVSIDDQGVTRLCAIAQGTMALVTPKA